MAVPECIFGGLNMEEMYATFYDAHVKAHERHILLQWLEDAKTEKIKKLKEKKISVEIKKVKVPAPEITGGSLAYEQILDKKRLDVSESLVRAKIHKGITYMPSIANPAFTNNSLIPKVEYGSIGEYRPMITKEMFDHIVLADVDISGTSIDTHVELDDEKFKGIVVGSRTIPERVDLSGTISVPDSFDIEINKEAAVSKVDLSGIATVDKSVFDDIELEETVLNKNDISFSADIDHDMFAEMIPNIIDNIEMPDKDSLVFDPDSIKPIEMKTISVPDKTDINIEISINSPDGLILPEVDISESKSDTEIQIKMPNDVLCKPIEIPEPTYLSENYVSTMPKVKMDNIELPERTDIQGILGDFSFESIDFPVNASGDYSVQSSAELKLEGIEMPSIHTSDIVFPDRVSMPAFEEHDFSSSVGIPKITIPEKTADMSKSVSVRKVQIDLPEISTKTVIPDIPKPTPIRISLPSVNLNDKPIVPSRVQMLEISIIRINTVIPDKTDIMEMLERDKSNI